MKAMSAYLLIVCIAMAACSYKDYARDRSKARLLKELEYELSMEDNERGPFMPMSRGRRVVEEAKQRRCGREVFKFVQNVCDGPCSISSGADMATHCCQQQCDAAYIRQNCCP